jgi:LEA14-like dessication related protein
MRKIALAAAVTLATTAAACSTLVNQTFAEPVVTLRDVQIRGLGLTGGSMDVQLAVYNPNNFRLDVGRMTYQLLAGAGADTVTFATGTVEGQRNFAEKDTSIVTIPVSFSYAGIGAVGRQLLNSGSVNYTVRGDVTVATPIGNFTRPYSHTGRYSTLGQTR